MQIRGWNQPNPSRNESVGVIEGGGNIVVEGVTVESMGDLGTVDISADRLVIWSTTADKIGLSGETVQDDRIPLELYAEGNIVFRAVEAASAPPVPPALAPALPLPIPVTGIV